MYEQVVKKLKEKSDEAILSGNKFQGFGGLEPEAFSKRELIMLLNALNHEKVKAEKDKGFGIML